MPTKTYTDAIALLKADHREVEELFEKFEKAKSGKERIAAQICTDLKIHTMIEEEIFYPRIKDSLEEDDYNEALIEHDAAKVLINDIESSNFEGEFFESKVKVLSEEILHHVKEEEQPKEGIFAHARESGADLVAMRDQLQARKDELMAQAKSAGLPPAQLTAVDADAS